MSRVLVVDDCLDTDTTLQWLLREWGHEACVATDGETALKMADIFHPDAVILDIGLPGIDGYDVAKSLRQFDPRKPFIIAHSGYCTEADVRRSLEAGCNHHLPKPIEPDEIKRLLESCEHKPST
jgi:CheY-like chemotaxis protein